MGEIGVRGTIVAFKLHVPIVEQVRYSNFRGNICVCINCTAKKTKITTGKKQKSRKRQPNVVLNSQSSKNNKFCHAPVFAENDTLQTSVTCANAEMLAIVMESFSKVEHREFRNLPNKLEPR